MSSFTLQYASQVLVNTVVAKNEFLFFVSLKNLEKYGMHSIKCMHMKIVNYYHNLNSKARGASVTLSTCIALRKEKKNHKTAEKQRMYLRN